MRKVVISWNNFFLFVLCLIIPSNGKAQQITLHLLSAQSQVFHGNIYSFGIQTKEKQTELYIYQLDFKLTIKDSLHVPLASKGTDYLQCSADTLHGTLNVYIQKKEKTEVALYRFDTNFKLTSTIEQIEIARLKSISAFNNELLYFQNDVYAIKTQKDTSGIQFYLNKYSLKAETKRFEYEYKWQFPFERKNIQSVHIFYANSQFVMVYVQVASGQKAGQWLLKINANNARLIRGTKLNEKGEDKVYAFGNTLYEPASKSTLLIGEKFTSAQYLGTENKLAITGTSVAVVYIIRVDSIGDVVTRQEFKLPCVPPKSQNKKNTPTFILQIQKLYKVSDGNYFFETDLYNCSDKSSCYMYCNSLGFSVTTIEDQLQLEKKSLSAQPQIETLLQSNDKLNMNGKICSDSSGRIEQLFYKRPSLAAKLIVSSDSLNRTKWLLCKSDVKKSTIAYHVLKMNKTFYDLKLVAELSKSWAPTLMNLSAAEFALAYQEEEGKYVVKLVKW